MNLDAVREKKELVSSVLLIVTLLSAVLILVKVTGFFVTSARAGSAVKDAIQNSKPDAKNLSAQLDKSKEVADALKQDNLFSPPAPKRNPITAVKAIMGDEALINGKWYQAGDKVGDAEILAVNTISVETEWDGKKTVFNPIDGGQSSGGPPSRPGRSGPRRGAGPPRAGRPGMVVTQGSKPAARGGGGGTPDWRSMTREKMMSMSEGERAKYRAKMRANYERMSDSEKEEFRDHMRKQFGGRPGGGDGRGRRPIGRQPMRLNTR